MIDPGILMTSPSHLSNLRTHRIRNAIIMRSLLLAIIGLLGMIALILIGVWRWQYAASHFGPAVIWRWIAPVIFPALLLALIGIVALIHLLRIRRIEAQVSPMGLTLRKGRNLHAIPWKEVKNTYTIAIRYGILGLMWARKLEIVLQLENGKRIAFNQAFEEIEALMNTIKQYVYPIMFRNLQSAFNQGEPIRFGPLILTSQGVLNGRKALRWQDISQIKMRQGRLLFQPFNHSKGKPFSLPAHKIPDIDLCLQLLHQLGPQS